MNQTDKNTHVKKQITRTLLEMMKTADFSSISICSLTAKAGVGRASFYRSFKSREDVLKQESDRLAREWGAAFENSPDASIDTVFVSLLDFYKEHAEFYTALYQAGLSRIMLDTITDNIGIPDHMPNAQAYLNCFLAYGIYGWIKEWIKRGMQESGTELHEMFQKDVKKPPAE